MLQDLNQKIDNRQAVISIFGQGYVGLPLATLFVKAGFKVIGFDTNEDYIQKLKAGISSVLDVTPEVLVDCLATGRFIPTSRTEDLKSADIHVICVPTPLSKSRQPDMSYIESALGIVQKVFATGQMVILESTTYPGTTDEVLLPALSGNGLKLDRDFLLAFSPERVDPGNLQHPLHTITKVVGGVSKDSTTAATALYATIFDKVHPVSQARTAELAKLLENTFRNVNIALVNEFSQVCDAIGVDIWETIGAAKTKPFGFMAFYPGPGIGGHCIPLDPSYLVYKSRLHGYEPRLVALADQINFERPRYIVQQVIDQLNGLSKSLKGSKVLVMGVAYKADVPDVRESPALPILSMLLERGAHTSFSDPWVTKVRLDKGEVLQGVPFTEEQLKGADLILVITPHSDFDYQLLRPYLDKVLDTRNVIPATLSAPAVTASLA